ncbi:alpha/beta hydrolase [uncultured Roseobacter sp.]|uniref:alpha/beta hydrolase n=1 Tax=uncultured Roseobacter sp. TaxID=114847 RepID=UPI0026095AAB|nr:alpha/beta hydrolase [uncultured Roseobacter sp.]
MRKNLQIFLLGQLHVIWGGAEVTLPASRKTRALLAFLVATDRPHRRERLCEVFWNLPDDPKAALRWALSKLRGAGGSEDQSRIVADRERVFFDTEGAEIDTKMIYTRLLTRDDVPTVAELTAMERQLDQVFLDGLDGAGDDVFDMWLVTERENAQLAHITVLKQLAMHPDVDRMAARKWRRLWQEADPLAVLPPEQNVASVPDVELPVFASPYPDQAETASASFAAKTAQRIADRKAGALRAQRIGFCKVCDGTKIAYATLGQGPPLLKAANWLNHLEFDWNSPIWGRSFAEIARYRNFIRYDERGCGLSDWDVDDLSFDAFVEDLEAVADKLELERFPLLGISQGAAVSIEYAVRHPERVSGLILVGAYAAGWRHLTDPEEQARREAVLTLTELGWGTDNSAYRHIFSRTFMPEATREELEWFDEFQRQTTSPRNAARFQNAFGEIDVRHRLAQVKVPTIVLHSRYDQRIPLNVGREVASGIPNAHFVPLESRNHILIEREPAWKTCAETIGQFLAEKKI